MPQTHNNNTPPNNSTLKITLLGTGTSVGIPMIGCPCEVCHSTDIRDKRLRTSALFSINGTNICIDSGPDFRQQMLSSNTYNLQAILYTHAHQDHIAGLDDVRAFNIWQQSPIDLYMEANVHETLRTQYPYIFETENKYPGAPEVIPHFIAPETPFYIKNIPITPIRVLHGNLPILGFRIQNTTYITDAKRLPESSFAQIIGTEILIVNALRPKEHWSHFTLAEALAFVQKINPKQAYLTHLSHQIGLHAELEKTLPDNVFVGYDGQCIETTFGV